MVSASQHSYGIPMRSKSDRTRSRSVLPSRIRPPTPSSRARVSSTLARLLGVGGLILDGSTDRERVLSLFDRIVIPYECWDAETIRQEVPGLDPEGPPKPVTDDAFWADPRSSCCSRLRADSSTTRSWRRETSWPRRCGTEQKCLLARWWRSWRRARGSGRLRSGSVIESPSSSMRRGRTQIRSTLGVAGDPGSEPVRSGRRSTLCPRRAGYAEVSWVRWSRSGAGHLLPVAPRRAAAASEAQGRPATPCTG